MISNHSGFKSNVYNEQLYEYHYFHVIECNICEPKTLRKQRVQQGIKKIV